MISLLITYGIPLLFALITGWMKYKEQKAKGSVDLLTTAIEIANSKEVKQIVAELSKGTAAEGVIEASLDRLNEDKIREFIRTNKKIP